MYAIKFPAPGTTPFTSFSPGKLTVHCGQEKTEVLRAVIIASQALSSANGNKVHSSVDHLSRAHYTLAHELAHHHLSPAPPPDCTAHGAQDTDQTFDPVKYVAVPACLMPGASERLLRFVGGVLAALRLMLVRLLTALSRHIGRISFVFAMIAACRRYGLRQECGDHFSLHAHSCRIVPGRLSAAR